MSNTGISSSSLTGQLEYINRQYHDVCELYEDLSKERDELKQSLRECEIEYNMCLSERGNVLRENQSLFDTVETLKKDLDKATKSKEEYIKECDMLRKKNMEMMRNRNEYMQSDDDLISEKDKMAYVSLEMANQEIEKLKKHIERGKNEVAKANQEMEIAKGRRDWAIVEREKIVNERDSMRNLCDELRKERDTSTSRLLSAIRDKDEANSKIEILKEKIDTLTKRLKSAEAKSAKAPTSSEESSEDEIEVNVTHLLVNADLGLTLQCNPESGEYNNNNSYPKVIHVESDSIFAGKLFRGDNIQYVNGIDCSTLSQRMLFKTIRTSAPTCKMTVRRSKQYEKEVYGVKLKNIKNSGISFDIGVFIRDIKVNSPGFYEPLMFEGDRVLQINNQVIEKNVRNYDDLNQLLMKIEDEENIQMKLQRTFSVNRSATAAVAVQQPTNNRWSKMINSSTQTTADRNSSVPGFSTETVPFTPTSDIHDQESSSNYSNASLPSPNSSKSLSKFSGSYILQKFRKIRKTNKDTHENDALAVLDSILDSQDSWDSKDKKKNKHKQMIAKSWPRAAINTNVSETSQSGTIVFNRKKERPKLFPIDAEEPSSKAKMVVKDNSPKDNEIEMSQMANNLFTPPPLQYPIHPPQPTKRGFITPQTFQPNVQTFERRSAEKKFTYDNPDLKRRSLNVSGYNAAAVRQNFHRNSFSPIKPVSTTSTKTPFIDIHAPSSLSNEKYLSKNTQRFDSIDKNTSMDSTYSHNSKIQPRNVMLVPEHPRVFQPELQQYANDMGYLKQQYPSPIMFPQHEATPNTSSNLYSSIRSSQNSSTDGSLSFEKMKLLDSKEEMFQPRRTPVSYHDGTFPRKLIPKLVKTSNNSLDYGASAERASPLPKFQIHLIKPGKGPINGRVNMLAYGQSYKPNIGDQREIRIDKSSNQLGISIEYRKGRGIFVSQVEENSIASQVGLQIGDQLLDISGINLRSATFDMAAKIIRQCSNSISILAQYNPLKYKEPVGSDEDSTPQNSPKLAMRSMMSEDSLQEFKHMSLSSHLQPLVSNGTLKKSQPSSRMSSETSTSSGKEQPRVVLLHVNFHTDLGISLFGGNAYGIFVNSIKEGSIAEKSGLRVGDQILEYGDTDLRHATAEKAARDLSRRYEKVVALVQYNMQKFNQVKDKPGDSFYIRVGFDRQVERNELMLSFNKEEVLYVENTMFQGVAGRWKAWKLDDFGYKMQCGIIPSQTKVDEELRQQGDLSCLEDQSNRRNSNSSARRSFFKRIKPQRGSMRDSKELASFNNNHLSLFFDSQTLDDGITGYQRVERFDYENRPIIVTGALCDLVVDKLASDYPEKFRKCEVSELRCSKDELEMQLKDNNILEYRKNGSKFELVTLQSVKENLGSHGILNVNLSTIERLHKNNIYPIVVLLKFKSWKQIKEIKDSNLFGNATLFSSKQAKEMYEFALKIESEYKNYISVVIHGVNVTHMSTQIKTAVDIEQKKILWVPVKMD